MIEVYHISERRLCHASRSSGPNDEFSTGQALNDLKDGLAVPLFALLALSIWFAGAAWEHIGGEPIPFYGYVAIVGGVLISLLVGGGLMALVFYSSRHGYDDLSGGDK